MLAEKRRYQTLYFVFFAAGSGITAFRNVYFEELGLSGFQMGVIGAVMVLDSGLEYGSVRAFGAIAFGIGLVGIGSLVEWFGTTVVFYIYVLGMAAFFVPLWGLPKPDTTVAPDYRSEAARLLRNRRFLVLLVVGVVMGGVVSAGASFFAVFMRDIQAGDDITGMAWFIRTVGEAIIFLAMARIGLDYRWQLSLGVGAYVVGYGVYGITGAVPAIVAVQLMLGVGYAMFNLSTVNLAHRFAPEALSSTAQAVMTGVGIGAGRAVGQLVGGQLVDMVGTQELYLWLAGATVFALLVTLVFHLPGVGTDMAVEEADAS